MITVPTLVFRTALVVLVLGFVSTGPLTGESHTDQRLRAGIKIYRVLLKSNTGISAAKGADGALTLLLVAADSDPPGAADIAREIEGSGEKAVINGLPIRVQVVTAGSLASRGPAPIAGLFVVERLPDEALRKVVEFGIARRAISFSPFEGDVERGVLSGLTVDAKVSPIINLKTLKASGISISAMLLKVSRTVD